MYLTIRFKLIGYPSFLTYEGGMIIFIKKHWRGRGKIMSNNDQYIREKKSQIDRWITELAVLDLRSREKGETYRIKFEVSINDFSDYLTKMQQKLDELASAREADADSIKKDTEDAWYHLKGSYKQAISNFREINKGP